MSRDTRAKPYDMIFAFLLLVPAFAFYGLYVLAQKVLGVPRRLRALRSAASDVIPCRHGHPNPTLGRFECAACHATYHGWVGCCELCGAGARWIECVECGIAVPLPWERS